MLNFTVGPVQSNESVLAVGAEQTPYFRTPEFSDLMKENEVMMRGLMNATEDSRVVFLTGSGTAAMEATVMNTLTPSDRALVINGGSFGERFAQILRLHEIPCEEIRVRPGDALTEAQLLPFEGGGYTAFLVNMCETSVGLLYPMELISAFCRRNGLFLIVDAISAFLADSLDMSALNAGAVLTGSQKALACPPGISVVTLSPEALRRVADSPRKCMYLDLKSALKDGERGQTPFTPAVGILRQIHVRMKEIYAHGGALAEIRRTAALAESFRNGLNALPLEIASKSLSNAVTPLHPVRVSAYQIFLTLKDEYHIWVCPNGGDMRDTLFRVGHLGNLSPADNETLIFALEDLCKRGLL